MDNKNDFRTTVYLGTIDGKPIRKCVRASSKEELQKKVIILKNEIAKTHDIYITAYFDEWADKWLNEYKIPSGISLGTINQYDSAIKHLNSEFKHMELKDINLSMFQKFINKLSIKNPNTNKPMSKSTLSNIIKVAKGIFRYARSNRVAGVPDFFQDVIVPKNAIKNYRRALTEQEQEMIIDTPHRCQLAAMIMMFSGLRRGELIPLEWSDINLNEGYIIVNKSVDLQSGKSILKDGGKSANANRIISIPPILIEYLQNYKKFNHIFGGIVCPNMSGNYHTNSSFRKMWDSYLLELNIKYGYPNRDISKFQPYKIPMKIERFTPHYLRHTYATILYLQGIDVVTMKQMMGHSNIQTTVDIYTDLQNNKTNLSDNYKEKLINEYKINCA